MIHLSDEQIYNLAELTIQMYPYSEEEKKQMEHMKECESCYNKFCAILALEEVLDESGFVVLSEIYVAEHSRKKKSNLNENVLAVVKVLHQKVGEKLIAVMEQVRERESVFCFEPPLSFATRGIEENESTVFKIEDIEDGKTFLMFDFDKNELLVQININDKEVEEFDVYIKFENGQEKKIPVTKKGKFVKGVLRDIPEMNFEIYINLNS